MNLVKLLSDYAYDGYVIAAAEYFDMRIPSHSKSIFGTYSIARYAADVIFLQKNRPWRNRKESKSYCSDKHQLYGYLTEVSVISRFWNWL